MSNREVLEQMAEQNLLDVDVLRDVLRETIKLKRTHQALNNREAVIATEKDIDDIQIIISKYFNC